MVQLVPKEVLQQPPSRQDGIDRATEENLRAFGAQLIQSAGVLLKVPQAVVVSAAVIFQRFYFLKSFAEFEVRAVAAGALALACKLEETHRKLQQVLTVFFRLEMRDATEDSKPCFSGKPVPFLDINGKEYEDMKKGVVRAERSILRELGFDVVMLLEHPHRHVLQAMGPIFKPGKILQKAWNYLNDSLRTSLCCAHQPQHIAAASLLLAARSLEIKLPSHLPWWEAIEAEGSEMRRCAAAMMAMYRKPAPEWINIPRRKKVVPDPPATPFELPFETPAPAMSPGSDEERNGGAEEVSAPPRQDSGLDTSRIAEMLDSGGAAAETKGDAGAVASMPPPAEPASARARGDGGRKERESGFDRPDKERDRGRDRDGRRREKEKEKRSGRDKRSRSRSRDKRSRSRSRSRSGSSTRRGRGKKARGGRRSRSRSSSSSRDRRQPRKGKNAKRQRDVSDSDL